MAPFFRKAATAIGLALLGGFSISCGLGLAPSSGANPRIPTIVDPNSDTSGGSSGGNGSGDGGSGGGGASGGGGGGGNGDLKVLGVHPGSGGRGTKISLSGDGFVNGMTVAIGGVPCSKVEVAPPSSLTCLVQKGFGGIKNVTVTTPSSQQASLNNGFTLKNYVYVTNRVSEKVSIFNFNPESGSLQTTNFQSFSADIDITTVDLTPDGSFLFTSDSDDSGGSASNAVIMAKINTTDGSISSSIRVVDWPMGGMSLVAMDPLGRFFYAYHHTLHTLTSFKINYNDGTLTKVSEFANPTPANSIVPHPNGKWLYFVEGAPGAISKIDISSGGEFSNLKQIQMTGGIAKGAIHPEGKFFYISSPGSATIAHLHIDQVSGELTVRGSSSGSPTINKIAFTPDGKKAYVLEGAEKRIRAYSVQATEGSLNVITGATTPVVAAPIAITYDNTGQYLYVLENGDFSDGFKIDQTGSLTSLNLPENIAGQTSLNLTFH